MSTPAPIIPVLDERLICPADGAPEHKFKIDNYNELLESVFHRELELTKLKASLLDMRHEIVEEGQTLDTRGTVLVPGPATELGGIPDGALSDNDAASLSEGSGVTSDSASEKPKAPKKRRGSKGKYKGKGRERARISGEEMGANWDYNVNPSKRQRPRRASDASESDVDEVL